MTASEGVPAAPLTLGHFFAGVRQGRLLVQRCADCGELAVPPRARCPACGAAAWAATALGGDGVLTSFTVIRVPPGRLAAEAPYVIAVVRMAEGVSLLGRLPGARPEDLQVGLPVRFDPPAVSATDPPVIAFRLRP